MRSAVLITGASRGFGRCLAEDFARETPSGDLDLVRTCARVSMSLFSSGAFVSLTLCVFRMLWLQHLLARHEQDLQETERLARDAWATRVRRHDVL